MISDYSSEIKVATLQSISECQCAEEGQSSNCDRVLAKIVHFNGVNSKITGRKPTKFVHNVAILLPFNILKAASL